MDFVGPGAASYSHIYARVCVRAYISITFIIINNYMYITITLNDNLRRLGDYYFFFRVNG